ncbi:ComEA family DNA-binding protein [Psychromicrobium xiongbiense]|uniref:ComEA family DNA-binding protein n=1 Tax=Psychromicrobium xiongbiense TaxID=3051184 RepID=UPI0025555302|nr:ComEA family DNA-binding protein [Psychromicrobium sp. YIM S02556]
MAARRKHRSAEDRLAALFPEMLAPAVSDREAAEEADSGMRAAADDAQSAPPAPSTGRTRWRLGRWTVMALVLALLLGVGVIWWMRVAGSSAATPGGPRDVAVGVPAPGSSGASTPGPGDTSPGATEGQATVVVHVAGAVTNPGVVTLPEHSRVYQAIAAAGGATPEAAPGTLNLAAVLTDGEQILVPTQDQVARGEVPSTMSPGGTGGTPGAGGSGNSGSSGNSGKKVNLNTAAVEELATLPRVGPVLAQRIVDWRQQHGKFRSVQDLDAVPGIGPKLLESLTPLVTV